MAEGDPRHVITVEFRLNEQNTPTACREIVDLLQDLLARGMPTRWGLTFGVIKYEPEEKRRGD